MQCLRRTMKQGMAVLGSFAGGRSHVTIHTSWPCSHHLPVPEWPLVLSALPCARSLRPSVLWQSWQNIASLSDSQAEVSVAKLAGLQGSRLSLKSTHSRFPPWYPHGTWGQLAMLKSSPGPVGLV